MMRGKRQRGRKTERVEKGFFGGRKRRGNERVEMGGEGSVERVA